MRMFTIGYSQMWSSKEYEQVGKPQNERESRKHRKIQIKIYGEENPKKHKKRMKFKITTGNKKTIRKNIFLNHENTPIKEKSSNRKMRNKGVTQM